MNKMNELCEMELTGRYEEKLSALKAEISAADEYIRQDNSDLTEFENRYERLDIPYRVKDFWMTILRVCRQNMNVLQTCAIWRENKDYKKTCFICRNKVL